MVPAGRRLVLRGARPALRARPLARGAVARNPLHSRYPADVVDPSTPEETELSGAESSSPGFRFLTQVGGGILTIPLLVVLLLFTLGLILLPIAGGVAGIVMVASSYNAEAAAQAYLDAKPCALTSSADCYSIVSGTAVHVAVVRRGKLRTDTWYLDLQLPEGTQSVIVPTASPMETPPAALVAIQAGSPITVKLYHGVVTDIVLPEGQLPTRANPVNQRDNNRILGFIFVGVGIAWALGLIATAAYLRARSSGIRPPGAA